MVREPEEEYAPIIFAQDAYKGIISFDLLSASVSIHFPHFPLLILNTYSIHFFFLEFFEYIWVVFPQIGAWEHRIHSSHEVHVLA